MGNYRVLLHGHNLWLELEGRVRQIGFYVTRFVEAGTQREAERQALDLILTGPHVSAARNRRGELPSIDISECAPVTRAEVPALAPGYALYLVDESEVA